MLYVRTFKYHKREIRFSADLQNNYTHYIMMPYYNNKRKNSLSFIIVTIINNYIGSQTNKSDA